MEYEYSYKVKSLKEYLKYIESKYEFKEKYKEKRVIYRGDGNIARITYKNDDMYLDFKEDKLTNKDLIVRKESKTIKFDNLENCEDILSFLGYVKDNSMTRNRTIYEGKQIKFEIDEYLEPEKAYVVSFEGAKKVCDELHSEMSELNKKYQIK